MRSGQGEAYVPLRDGSRKGAADGPATLLVAGMVSAAAPATADGGACPTGDYSSNFVGAVSTYQSSIYGGKARIETMNPDLCGGGGTSSGSSSAWVMVTAKAVASNGSDGHAQVGYLDMGALYPYVSVLGAPSGYHRFSEWTRKCLSNPGATGPCGPNISDNIAFSTYATPGANTDTFDVHRVASDGLIHMYINGNDVDHVGYNTTNDWKASWAVEILGETKDWQDNLVGTPGNPVNFDTLQRYESDGSINYFTGLTKSEEPPRARYHFAWTTGANQQFKIWTDPL